MRDLIEQVAVELGADPALVEKDWHLVQVVRLVAGLGEPGVQPIFSGGTSLAKGWGVIKRFSEDVDFKVAMPGGGKRAARSRYRERVLAALQGGGFAMVGQPLKGDASSYFSADFAYEAHYPAARGLRPHVRIEMSFVEPALPPQDRPVQSLVSAMTRQPPELAGFPCIDPVETAADKLSALAWRVLSRERGGKRDDPTIIRHLHDLAALAPQLVGVEGFPVLVHRAMAEDVGRGAVDIPAAVEDRCAAMLNRLASDALWAQEYDDYVDAVSFAPPGERIGFAEALGQCRQLAKRVKR